MQGIAKKVLAALIIFVIIFGWYVSIFGISFGEGKDIPPLKDSIKLGLDVKGGVYAVMEAETDATGDELKKLMSQTQGVIERRVNEMGLSEPVVTIEGTNKIRVELPGADNAEEAVEAIGRTAQLQFVKPDGTIVLTGSDVRDASITTDTKTGGYGVALKFNSSGTNAFRDATTELSAMRGQYVTSELFGEIPANLLMIALDGSVISSPSVDEPIPGGNAVITGSFTDKEAAQLAALIRGGALPVTLYEVQSSMVGPTLGLNAFEGSVFAGTIGILLIMVFMFIMYRFMGLTANIALLLYVLIVVWTIIAFGAVLTLPGMAGIILSVGMAVDSNIIIFSRIQEEVAVQDKTLRVGISSGFRRAMGTIIDTHIATIIVGIILYQFGSGPVKGFSVTLMIGIITSLFTAVAVTQLFLSLFSENRALATNKKLFGI